MTMVPPAPDIPGTTRATVRDQIVGGLWLVWALVKHPGFSAVAVGGVMLLTILPFWVLPQLLTMPYLSPAYSWFVTTLLLLAVPLGFMLGLRDGAKQAVYVNQRRTVMLGLLVHRDGYRGQNLIRRPGRRFKGDGVTLLELAFGHLAGFMDQHDLPLYLTAASRSLAALYLKAIPDLTIVRYRSFGRVDMIRRRASDRAADNPATPSN